MAQAIEKKPENNPQISVISDGYAQGKKMPWQLKFVLKVFLSKIPVSYEFWDKFGIFRHGELGTHFPNLQKCWDDQLKLYRTEKGKDPKNCLELGPGDSLGHVLSMKADGIAQSYFVDVADFASKEAAHYQSFYDYLTTQNGKTLKTLGSFERADVLKACNAQYFTNGLHDMPKVPDDSIDLSFSWAVLEHVARDHFAPYMKELFRAHKKGGLSHHAVDLHDHLGGALNSMRFPAKFWESNLNKKAGFYTNRLSMDEMVKAAEEAGFEVEVTRIIKWAQLPTPASAMHVDFKDKSEDELNVCTFYMILRKG